MHRRYPNDKLLYGVRNGLAQQHKRLFLIIDEVETIWAPPSVGRQEEEAARRHRMQDRAHNLLYALANVDDSTIVNILCGSTASLGCLIRGVPVPPDHTLRRESLNGTKFNACRIGSNAPTDRKAAETMVDALMPQLRGEPRDRMINGVLFIAGANPRMVAKYLSSGSPMWLPEVK
jgi:hypothetical protein